MPDLNLEVTRVFRRTQASRARVVVNVGGARSSKSFSVAQVLLLRFLTRKNYKLIITRKTFPALRATAMYGMVTLMQELGVYNSFVHNKSESTIIYGSNIIRFISIDDPTRIMSMEANDIWMEEANEFTWKDFIWLKTRLSAPVEDGCRNQAFLTLNPSDAYGWINQRLCNAAAAERADNETEVILSTYKDNPFLDADYIKDLEGLAEQDETYYKIFALGVWASPAAIIYNNYDIIPASKFPTAYDEVLTGIDFGYNNPTAAIQCGVVDGNQVYLRELLYETHMTNGDLIARLPTIVTPSIREHTLLRADAAEPDRIEEIKRAGWRIEAAPKGANSVRDGIDFVKRLKLHVCDEDVNLIKEIRGYKWREALAGGVTITLDEPVKYLDHAMDAKRYALTALKGYLEPATSWMRNRNPGQMPGKWW